MRASVAAVLVAAALGLAGCSGSDSTAGSPQPSPSRSIRTLTPLPMPPTPPPNGTLHADMRQSSRDAAAGRIEVWVYNDTVDQIRPRRISYADPRFRTELPATRLRPVPSQSERGFQITLPARPACDHPTGHGTLTLSYGDTTKTLPVHDTVDVVGRTTSDRCLDIAVAAVATLRWSDRVPFDGTVGDPSTLTLVVTTSGHEAGALTIDTVSGTPVLSPVGTDVWRPGVTIHGTDDPRTIALPLKPTRCDAHAFAESGGATTFKIGLHLDGRPGQIALPMSILGARHALHFAQASCGMLSSITNP